MLRGKAALSSLAALSLAAGGAIALPGGRLTVAALFLAGGAWAVAMVGMSGGPNHGEHPFTVNLCHLVAWVALAGEWPPGLRWSYLGVLAAALVLSVLVMPLRVWDQPRLVWSLRGVMAALYLALGGILLCRWGLSRLPW